MKKLKRLMGLLVPYAICVLIPFLAVIGMAGIISGLYRGQIVENREEIVKNAFEDVLDKISAVEEVGSYLKGNERINQYAVANLLGNGNSYAEYMEMQEMFTDLMKGRPIQGITLSDFKNNRIMTDVGMTSNIRRYYNSVYKLEGLSTDEMQARYREVPILPKWHGTVDALSNKKHLKLIEYTMQVPETYLTYYPMTLTIKVNAEVLFEELEEVLAEGDEIFIYNVDKEEENLVWSKGTRYTEMPWAETEGALLKMSGNGASNMWEMKLSSEDGAWMARIYLSNVLESMFSGEMITVLMVIMLVLLISFAVCIYFTFYNYRNIQSLMKLMSETEEENETYDSTYGYQTLQEPIKRLVDEKNRVQKKADDIKRKNMAESLFLGNADREKDREAVETLGLKDAAVRVLCLRYIDSDYRKYFSGGGYFRKRICRAVY